jgi:hypothetical protein
MAKINQTPYGKNCIVVDQDSRFANTLRDQTKGSFQLSIVEELITQGYTLGTRSLKGKAANYRGRYAASLQKLVWRINKVLDTQAAPHKIQSGEVGPKG